MGICGPSESSESFSSKADEPHAQAAVDALLWKAQPRSDEPILANFLEQQKGFANGRAIHPFYFGLLGFCYALLSNGEFFLHMPQPSEKSSGKLQSTRPPETFSETVAIKIHEERP